MSEELFCSSMIAWFTKYEHADDVMRTIADASGIDNQPEDLFRCTDVFDATTRRQVTPAAERLLRWSTTAPQEAFRFGFLPPVNPNEGDFANREAFNLRTFVAENHDSIFISTARFYRNDADRLTRWERRLTSARQPRFEYEIFAYGGIDVNAALGHHAYEDQHAVAFPGGIRPEFIREAREYMGTRIVRIWRNTHFSTEGNMGYAPALADLPALRGLPPDVPQPTSYPPREPDEPHTRETAQKSEPNELMFGEGDARADEMFGEDPAPLTSVAFVAHPDGGGKAYVFCGNRYACIRVVPGTTDDTLEWGPHDTVRSWPSLSEAGFAGAVDAVLPNADTKGEMYFFAGREYALVRSKPGTEDDYVVNGPKSIASEWPSLCEAGFETVDAVLANPKNPSREAYFFSGTRYVLIYYKPATTDDYILNGPKDIQSNWPSLKNAGFPSVDAILPHPTDANQAYFFYRDQYALIEIKPGTTDDHIINGPKAVRTEWPSLVNAGFW